MLGATELFVAMRVLLFAPLPFRLVGLGTLKKKITLFLSPSATKWID